MSYKNMRSEDKESRGEGSPPKWIWNLEAPFAFVTADSESSESTKEEGPW